MEVGEKEKCGNKKIFAQELGSHHLQFASYAYEFTTSVRLWHWCTSVAIIKMHKIWLVNSQENY